MSNFENACFKACDDWVNEIECNVEPDYSKEHIKRIKDISKGKGSARFGSKKLRILLVAAIILLLNVTAFAVVQSKQFVYTDGLFPNTYNFRLDTDEQKRVYDIEYGYIPEGFEEVERKFMFQDVVGDLGYCECKLEFSNGEQFFFLGKYIEGLQFSVDKQRETFMRIEDSGINYVFTGIKDAEGFTAVYWDNNGYAYMILVSTSSLSQEELLKIARDVK